MYQRLLRNIQARINFRNEDRIKQAWNEQLSYDSLHRQGLVNCYFEWQSIQQTFCYDNMVKGLKLYSYNYTEIILKWLKNQNENFRNSYLSYLFISGYERTVSKQLYIPLDIENMILLYSHIMFIKFYAKWDDNNYELRTFDANFTFNNLMKILENEHNTARFIRIWLRFGSIKFIYLENIPLNAILSSKQVLPYFDNNDNKRWVELPNTYYLNTINDIDKRLSYNEVLEIGVDIYNRVSNKYSFVLEDKQPSSVTRHCKHRFNWICSLKIGDIINVFRPFEITEQYKQQEAFIVYRDFDTFYVYCIDNDKVEGIKSIGKELNYLHPRYSLYQPRYEYHQRLSKTLNKCKWITDFKKLDNINNYGVLIEDISVANKANQYLLL